MEKKTLSTAVFISALLLSVGAQFVNFSRANPYRELGSVPPDGLTKPPTVTIFTPRNNSAHTTNKILFSVNVSLPESKTASSTMIHYIFYEADWQQDKVFLYNSAQASFDDQIESHRTLPKNLYFKCSQDLTGIPDGNHSIVVTVVAGGFYLEDSEMGFYRFMINGYSSVFFDIDTTPPKISVLSIENKTYSTTDIPLNFTVNEPVSQVSYSLDGQENVTIAGNTTLTNLPYGEHNVTVYATDMVGHIGASETIYFTIEEPFPTTLFIAPIASVAVAGVGLLVYFKKRNH